MNVDVGMATIILGGAGLTGTLGSAIIAARASREARTIVKGNGKGDVAKMSAAILDTLAQHEAHFAEVKADLAAFNKKNDVWREAHETDHILYMRALTRHSLGLPHPHVEGTSSLTDTFARSYLETHPDA